LSRTCIDLPGVTKRRERQRGFVPAFVELLSGARERMSLWRERVRYRSKLAQMSERELADIGVGWSQIAEEVAKPFWRA
jgi:uncharacterized protein YjiS (DUF1127 family)